MFKLATFTTSDKEVGGGEISVDRSKWVFFFPFRSSLALVMPDQHTALGTEHTVTLH